MAISMGVCIAWVLAGAFALFGSVLRRAHGGADSQERIAARFARLAEQLKHPASVASALGLLAFYATAFYLHWDVATGGIYFLLGLAGYSLLSCLLPEAAGIPLLGASLLISGLSGADNALQPFASSSFLFGMAAGVTLSLEARPANFLLPAIWLVGDDWARLAMDSPIASTQSLLAVLLTIVLFLRGFQAMPFFPASDNRLSFLLRMIVVAGSSGLACWLALDLLLLKGLAPGYAWLFAGGAALSFLLGSPEGRNATEPLADRPEATSLTTNQPVASTVLPLLWIGLASLAASRWFDAMGWVVLAAGILANIQTGRAARLAALFLLSRALLECFLHQYNPNVTGINILHPYVGTALYAGFIAMFLLSTGNITLWGRIAVLPAAVALLLSGAAAYFLHAEATGGLLVAVTVAGLGVSLLGKRAMRLPEASTLAEEPLFLALMLTNGALLSHELLDFGNQADKLQKLIVLGALAVLALVAWSACMFSRKQSLNSGEPVHLS